MKNYQVQTVNGMKEVSLNKKVVATFSRDLDGEMTFQLFLLGAYDFGSVSVYDMDSGKFLIGSIDQLTADLAQHNTPEARKAAGDFPVA